MPLAGIHKFLSPMDPRLKIAGMTAILSVPFSTLLFFPHILFSVYLLDKVELCRFAQPCGESIIHYPLPYYS